MFRLIFAATSIAAIFVMSPVRDSSSSLVASDTTRISSWPSIKAPMALPPGGPHGSDLVQAAADLVPINTRDERTHAVRQIAIQALSPPIDMPPLRR